MRIGINATCLNDRPSGARQRFAGIFQELLHMRPDDEFVVFEPGDCAVASWFAGAANLRAVRTPLDSNNRLQRAARGALYWPAALARERFDLFEAQNLPATWPRRGARLLTIHDVRGLRAGAGPLERRVYPRILASSIANADRVVVVSDAVRRELLAFAPDASVSVVHNGIDPARFARPDAPTLDAVSRELGLPRRFLLSVGHLERRKNYPALLEAMAALAPSQPDLHLLIVGNDSGEGTRIAADIRRQGLGERVRLLSGVPDCQLRALYASCSALVFASTYEGFGIPLLEAMAMSAPMAISDIPAFREVAADAAAYFDPCDPADIAGTVAGLLASPGERESLARAGRNRLPAFTFRTLAAGLSAAYDEAIAARTDDRARGRER